LALFAAIRHASSVEKAISVVIAVRIAIGAVILTRKRPRIETNTTQITVVIRSQRGSQAYEMGSVEASGPFFGRPGRGKATRGGHNTQFKIFGRGVRPR